MTKKHTAFSALMYRGIAAAILFSAQGCTSSRTTLKPNGRDCARIRNLSCQEVETTTRGLYSSAPLTHENIFHPTRDSRLARTYVVEKGDSLYKISRKFNTSVNAIARANNIANKSRIRAGTILRIPAADTHAG